MNEDIIVKTDTETAPSEILVPAPKKKSWYKSKIIWIAIIQAIIGVVVIFMTQFPEVGAIAIAKSVLDIVVRLITDIPIE